jgi:hypothetical protein
MNTPTNVNGEEQTSSVKERFASLTSFSKNYLVLIIYTGMVLPSCGFFLFTQALPGEAPDLHVNHIVSYGLISIIASLGFVLICYLYVCRKRCTLGEAFVGKMVAAIGGPIILILSNVALPKWTEHYPPNIYRSYLIGRLCFLIAMTMLLSVGMVGDKLEKQYEEGLVQLRMAWAAFALLFASDPVLAHYLQNIPMDTQMPEREVIRALVHLNFCGGITLLLLPLWKLSKLRRAMLEEERKSAAELDESLKQSQKIKAEIGSLGNTIAEVIAHIRERLPED